MRGPTAGRATASRTTGAWVAQAVSIVVALAGIVAVWSFVSLVVLSPERRFLLPPPHEVVATLGRPAVMGPMLEALGRTTLVAALGLAIAIAVGTVWAVLMAQSRWAERVLYPYAVIMQTIPILALTPLIGIWFGYGVPARVVVAVIIAVFPIISSTFFGLTSAPSAAAHDLFTLARASRWQRLVKLQAPAAVPSIFTGLRTAAGLSVIGAIVGDFFFQQGAIGVGGLLRVYTLRLDMEALLTAVGLTATFGVCVFSVFAALDRAVVGRWYGRSGRG
ncbi:ABC transporter permease [Litorihabitans aurantiacus]|uniref:Nitrate ABC transporter permease n=1 Tax=Litorihabitans aurantiacus TaxID=1930061 RepID=A0AA37XG43_9MICO|nr:ABC transporter permease subunit [Litorihabitans aurantiacus]GMA32686.1 nitrate ABC transporter permease [Litorihabitans aurantiacus]